MKEELTAKWVCKLVERLNSKRDQGVIKKLNENPPDRKNETMAVYREV